MIYVTEYKPGKWMLSQPCSCGTNMIDHFTQHYEYNELYTMSGEVLFSKPSGSTLTARCVNGHEMGRFFEDEIEICHYGKKNQDGNDILKQML